jgi:hypothetical protein
MRFSGPAAASIAIAIAALAVTATATAQVQVQPYGFNDAGGFRDILPPGNRGTVNAVEAAGFLGAGIRPA